MVARVTDNTRIPRVKLSDYIQMVEKKEIRPEVLPFEATIRCYNLTRLDIMDDVDNILKELAG